MAGRKHVSRKRDFLLPINTIEWTGASARLLDQTLLPTERVTLEWLLGQALRPLTWLMGVEWQDTGKVGGLFGTKTILNEFVAYSQLGTKLAEDPNWIAPRSLVIVSYSLCGFANFGSIGIQIGGISGIAPKRRSDLAKLGLRAMIGGTLAACLTATIAGLLV